MVTSNAVLPPMGKISMIGIWIETVLYGMSYAVISPYGTDTRIGGVK
jgi:hypothetical protein